MGYIIFSFGIEYCLMSFNVLVQFDALQNSASNLA